jgi:phosphohistidine swiveling domain-containing protein
MKRIPILPLFAISVALLSPSVSRADDLPKELLAAKAPKDAVSVVKAREKAKAGESIVVRGRIGGRAVALLPKSAIAVLADEKAITPCNAIPGDSCKIPWDYCCDDPAAIKASIATIQVRGEKGKVIRATLRGLGELKELSTVVVAGTVDSASNKDVLIINATAIHVEKP